MNPLSRSLGAVFLLAAALTACSRAPEASSDTRDVEPQSSHLDVPPLPNVPVVFTPERRNLLSPQEVPLLEQIDRENTRVVNAALPSIVRISASHPADPRMRLFGNEIPFQMPFGSNSHRPPPTMDVAYGSGVVISHDGYILTNNHVVEDAPVLQVQLNDKRTFDARLVAADESVDVAILKIDAKDLPPLPWGDSDKVQVGEQVFAIGNPFDLDDSVSKGIVSATGRNLPEAEADMPHYEDYIQTDAAINPGNSGGALVNIRGELIGLNAAIASTTRFSMGIGFAIPSNLVRYAVEGLLKDGRLVRGYIGVFLPDSVDDGVASQLDLKSDQGAFLAGVQHDSPAEKAGLQASDFITSVDGHKVDSEATLRLIVAQIPIGKKVQVDFLRDGKPQSTTLQIKEIPPEDQVGENSGNSGGSGDQFPPDKPPTMSGNVLSGLQVGDLSEKVRQKFTSRDLVTSGVVVNGVQEGSPADEKGIERGDVLASISVKRGTTQPLANVKDFTELSDKLKPDQGVVLLVQNPQRGSLFVYLAPPAK